MSDEAPDNAQDTLNAFFATQEPPAFDRAFAARAQAALQRQQMRDRLTLWGASAIVASTVLALTGNYIAEPLAQLAPAAAPLAIVWSVLFVMRRLPRRLR